MGAGAQYFFTIKIPQILCWNVYAETFLSVIHTAGLYRSSLKFSTARNMAEVRIFSFTLKKLSKFPCFARNKGHRRSKIFLLRWAEKPHKFPVCVGQKRPKIFRLQRAENFQNFPSAAGTKPPLISACGGQKSSNIFRLQRAENSQYFRASREIRGMEIQVFLFWCRCPPCPSKKNHGHVF